LSTTQTILVSTVAAVFAFVVNASGIFSAWFAYEQTSMMKDDRAREPELKITASYRHKDDPENKVQLTAGGDAAITFYITNYQPPPHRLVKASNVIVRLIMTGFEDSGGTIPLDSSGVAEFRVFDVAPADERFAIGYVAAPVKPGTYTVRWTAISNEGRWPRDGTYHSEQFEVVPQ